jgi:RHS repeat-associated protein
VPLIGKLFFQKELHIFGSSRVGMIALNKNINTPVITSLKTTNSNNNVGNSANAISYVRYNDIIGNKYFELSNHLGNVLVTVSDRKIPQFKTTGTAPNTVTTFSYFKASILSATDYYPFGMAMPGRQVSADKYRYGFNGKEKDNSTAGDSYDFGARIYDGRIGRWLSVDPSYHQYPSFSPYTFSINSPIAFNDPNGKWVVYVVTNPAGKLELQFVAEKNDNLGTLAMQLGLSENTLISAEPGLSSLKIETATTITLSNLKVVQNINTTLNNIDDATENCANVVARANGESLSDQYGKGNKGENTIKMNGRLKKNYISVTEENAQIGTVITYKLTKVGAEAAAKTQLDIEVAKLPVLPTRADLKAKLIAYAKAQGVTLDSKKVDAAITKVLADNVKKRADWIKKRKEELVAKFLKDETHFAVVVLKTVDGKKVKSVIQKHGDDPFKRDTTPEIPTGKSNQYERKPTGGGNNPYYTKKGN